MSAVTRFCRAEEIDSAVCGSIQGDLYMFRFPALSVDINNVGTFSIDKLNKVDMSLTRGYSAHTSMV